METVFRRLEELRAQYGPANQNELAEKLFLLDNYNTNRAEGVWVSQDEVARIVAEGSDSLFGFDFTQYGPVLGYVIAWKNLLGRLKNGEHITEDMLLTTHKLFAKMFLGSEAGEYRTCDVMIQGSGKRFTRWREVPAEVEEALATYLLTTDKHPLERIAKLKLDLIHTHPFVDGNGRWTRMIMNYLLMYYGYRPIIHDVTKHREYIAALKDRDEAVWLAYVLNKLEQSYE